jgi:hypothetical protein
MPNILNLSFSSIIVPVYSVKVKAKPYSSIANNKPTLNTYNQNNNP